VTTPQAPTTSLVVTTTEAPTTVAATTTADPMTAAVTTTEAPTTVGATTTEAWTSIRATTTADPMKAAITTTEAPRTIPATTTEEPTTIAATTTEAPTRSEVTTTDPHTMMSTMPVVTTTDASSTTRLAVLTTEATVLATTTSPEVTPTTRLRSPDSTFYVTEAGSGVVHKCKSAHDDSCATWLDLAGVSSLISSISAFNPNAIYLDQQADGTSRGLLLGTLTGDLIYCDMTPAACELIASNVGSLHAVGSVWDSEHTVTKFYFTTPSGGGVVNADGSGSVVYPATWSLATGGLFPVTPDAVDSDIIACTKRRRVERCPFVVDGKVSDCTTLISGSCAGIAPEYAATGALSGFVAVIGNQVQSCGLWGTNCQVIDGEADGNTGSDLASLNSAKSIAVERAGTRGVSTAYWIVDAGNQRVKRCLVNGLCESFADFQGQSIAVEAVARQEEVYPVTEPVELANISAELEVVIDESTKCEGALSPRSEIWFGMEDVFNELTGTQGWTLVNVTKVSSTNPALRRLADVATFALDFKLRYVAGNQTVLVAQPIFDDVQNHFMETVNEQVTGGNWTIISETYMAIEDENTGDIATIGDAPGWATISPVPGTSTTNAESEWDFDSSPRQSFPPLLLVLALRAFF